MMTKNSHELNQNEKFVCLLVQSRIFFTVLKEIFNSSIFFDVSYVPISMFSTTIDFNKWLLME